ncbi:ABC transporter ATP-binding protein [Alginatibacterium sediminis]|uniref:Probable ATP-binding protein YheS n=1 Tax=Alginatibacterium sediminis TaxID=2164068 RepID=A0A420E7A6_9ALTE|nr:ABC transporter ATP-binding protein [Alginatibacterium sediminis]RKF14431.1 ABC transporter ATP-binding protein [Alginatibacterium sediminis]
MIRAQQIGLQRGTKVLFESSDLSIHPGQKVGLVGRNGCGKSSLFALLRSQLQVDAGELSWPSTWEIASVAQETPASSQSALDYVIDGDRQYRQLQAKLNKAELADDGEQIARLHGELDTIQAYSIESRAGELLSGLGFAQVSQAYPVTDFSGGWRMRLNLAQALLCRSDLLLLDEPTNHLDLDTVVWLEQWLRRYEGTLILISHDREFLDNIVTRIVHVDQLRLNTYTGTYSDFEKMRAEKMAQQQALHEKQVRERKHMQSFVDRFRYKASKAKQAQSRLKSLEKMTIINEAHADSEFSFSFREPEALPLPLVQMEYLRLGYDDKVILDQIKFNLVPGSRIGLLGRNGAGKSTFIKLLAGELVPQAGELEVNKHAKVGYFAQHQLETLRPQDSPMDHLYRLAPDETEATLRNYLGSFGFHGDKALQIVAPFSGGEKARLVLALVVWQRPNLLLMDEPTNHLDLDMRHALTFALQNFSGAMVIVSHDRSLLQSTCDEFYLVDNQQVQSFDGDLLDYQRWLSQNNKPAINSDTTEPKKSVDRKHLKRLEAEFRQQTKPIRAQRSQAEKSVNKATDELAKLVDILGDMSLYEAQNKAKLQAYLAKQIELKQALEEAEMLWMEAEESLEILQSEFDAQQQ